MSDRPLPADQQFFADLFSGLVRNPQQLGRVEFARQGRAIPGQQGAEWQAKREARRSDAWQRISSRRCPAQTASRSSRDAAAVQRRRR